MHRFRYKISNVFKNGKFCGEMIDSYYSIYLISIVNVTAVLWPDFVKTIEINEKTDVRLSSYLKKDKLYLLQFNKLFVVVTEEQLNFLFIPWQINSGEKALMLYYAHPKTGCEISKAGLKKYKTQLTDVYNWKHYLKNIDIPLKKMFLYEEFAYHAFMGKTLYLLNEMQKTTKNCSSRVQNEELIQEMNKYLTTQLEILAQMSEIKTFPIAIRTPVIQKKNDFLEDLKIRNQLGEEFKRI